MIQQHRELQKMIVGVVELVEMESVDVDKVVRGLKEFSNKLTEHLKLENEKFYPKLLEGMKSKEQDTVKTEMFVAEMVGIEKAVGEFLTKYGDVDSVKNKLEELRVELPGIVDALTLRIESEEAGVYSYWGLF